jgi:hypothetical protein
MMAVCSTGGIIIITTGTGKYSKAVVMRIEID